MDPSSPPAFPFELERQIFEICALSRIVAIPRLMLVAWRVKQWVEPLFYRTLTIASEDEDGPRMVKGLPVFPTEVIISAIKTRPATFFRDSVRNVLLHDNLAGAFTAILSVCTGVENLSTNVKDDLSALASLSLKHLYATVNPIFRIFPPAHPVFSRLTHLELFDYPDDTTVLLSRLPLIPQLTHLSFYHHDLLSICPHLLQTCTFLSVLVCHDPWHKFRSGSAAALSRDVRFVVMHVNDYLLDWQMGAYTGLDYWTRAESFIAKRRSGEIDASQFELVEDDSNNEANESMWILNNEHHPSIFLQLTNVVDLRAQFYRVSETKAVIRMPHLQSASLEILDLHDSGYKLSIKVVLDCFDFLRLETLNLSLPRFHARDVLYPMPAQLKTLRFLRLCGSVEISNAALTCIMTELTMLTGLAVELDGLNVEHVFALLIPDARSVLLPSLQTLQLTNFPCHDGKSFAVLLTMLRARFGGVAGAEHTLLRLFELFLRRPFGLAMDERNAIAIPHSMLDSLKSLKTQKWWDIRVCEDCLGDFWTEGMDGHFL
ncbi:hypothetical protein FB451DRAFT_1500804 [Mycena latifolia]|nr:hypothetical protein FB451DRAFT_1500804 [Mycena latifolia]